MDLIFFDLDGTLLNNASEISTFTKETLLLLRDKNIAYTLATGRTMLSAQPIMEGHDFDLPHIYSNGVTVWDPKTKELSLENLLNSAEISTIVDTASANRLTPFVHTIDHGHQPFIFHAETQHEVEENLVNQYFAKSKAKLLPLIDLPVTGRVTNINMIGESRLIYEIWLQLNKHKNLVAYSGPALEGEKFSWIDIHHRQASKGSAVISLKKRLGVSNVICFGDSDNDLSMFELADESYAPKNAKEDIQKCVNKVIGYNHEDGVAHFLRERFSL